MEYTDSQQVTRQSFTNQVISMEAQDPHQHGTARASSNSRNKHKGYVGVVD